MKILIWLFLFMTIVQSKVITIGVAANMSDAIKPLVHSYRQYHLDTKVNVVLGSSGKLSAQIMHGAPYGILLSANMKYPQKLFALGFAKQEPVIYAQGALALLSTNRYDVSKGLELLKDAHITKIALGNPKTAPYGIAAMQALQSIHLFEVLKSKFVYGESISQTLLYTTKIADIGLVAKSALYAPKMSKYSMNKNWIEIPSNLYRPIEQGMLKLKDSKAVNDFYNFMLSRDAQQILLSYGYKVP